MLARSSSAGPAIAGRQRRSNSIDGRFSGRKSPQTTERPRRPTHRRVNSAGASPVLLKRDTARYYHTVKAQIEALATPPLPNANTQHAVQIIGADVVQDPQGCIARLSAACHLEYSILVVEERRLPNISIMSSPAESGMTSLLVRRRYRDFHRLAQALAPRARAAGRSLPSLPGKTLFRCTSATFAAHRQASLQRWLREVISSPELFATELCRFLGLRDPIDASDARDGTRSSMGSASAAALAARGERGARAKRTSSITSWLYWRRRFRRPTVRTSGTGDGSDAAAEEAAEAAAISCDDESLVHEVTEAWKASMAGESPTGVMSAARAPSPDSNAADKRKPPSAEAAEDDDGAQPPTAAPPQVEPGVHTGEEPTGGTSADDGAEAAMGAVCVVERADAAASRPELELAPMLDAFAQTLRIVETLGPMMALAVRNDEANFGKLRSSWTEHARLQKRAPSSRASLRWLLEAEVRRGIHQTGGRLADPSAAMALLWLRRSFNMVTSILEGMVADRSTPLPAIARAAYAEELETLHGWVLRKTFCAGFNAMPTRQELLQRLASPRVRAEERERTCYEELAELVLVQRRALGAITDLFVELGLEPRPHQ